MAEMKNLYIGQYEGVDVVGEWRLRQAKSGTWYYDLVDAGTGRRCGLGRESIVDAFRAVLDLEQYYEDHNDKLEQRMRDERALNAFRKWRALPWYRRLWELMKL